MAKRLVIEPFFHSLVEQSVSLSELQALEFPKIGSDLLLRNLQKQYVHLLRTCKKTIKKTRTKVALYFRSQYYITSATRDLKVAATKNEDIVISTLIIAAALIFSYMNIASELLLAFFHTALVISETTQLNMLILGLIVTGVFGVIAAWLSALITNMIAISVMEGSTRKQHKSVRKTLRKSLRYTGRVTGSWVAYISLLLIPQFVVGIATLVFTLTSSNPMATLETGMPIIAVAAITSMVVLIMNYGLMPYVALFEPEINLITAAKRSRELVRTKGRLFILSINGLFFGGMVVAFAAARAIESMIYIPAAVTFFVLACVLVLYTNCLMVMLYRKRKLARK